MGEYATSNCPCSGFLGILAGRVFRFCEGGSVSGTQWSSEVNTTECVAIMSETTQRLCQVAEVSIL